MLWLTLYENGAVKVNKYIKHFMNHLLKLIFYRDIGSEAKENPRPVVKRCLVN